MSVAFQVVFAVLALCGIGFYVISLWSARSFLRARRSALGFAPPVSILKPVRGIDPDQRQAFRSHCLQDYSGDYELIFGVADASDPVVANVELLRQEFPERRIELVVCPEILGANRKVSSLIQMLPRARFEHVLINDSDIRVEPDYLARVLRHFAPAAEGAAQTGMITALYRPIPGRTLGSRLEALGISTEFMAGVLTARQIEGGVHFALGSTLACTRSALAAIGGLETLVDYLADDFELGARISAAGYRVEIADTVVENHIPDYSMRDFFDHQLRWGRSTRSSRPWGYAGLALTFGVVWAAFAALASAGAWWSWLLLAAAAALRVTVALVVGLLVLHDRYVLRDLPLLPLRELIAVVIWVASYAGSRVHWRGEDFVLDKGKIRLA
ncbi:MAG: bacteriohopanetetrol glucosamine biosynthesis glycosyltransferase HpnI [Acidobacteriota bacterium]|nr:bacteriohopanetetrol glucosamine biosynthesis glycosyltransferase HpnI [Acidobacteriota bacterium]